MTDSGDVAEEALPAGTTGTSAPIGGLPPARLLLRIVLGAIAAAALLQWAYILLFDVKAYFGYYDFSFYYVAALALRDNPHANVYDPHVLRAVADTHHVFLGDAFFQYPLLLPILLVPLTFLSFRAATRLWLLGNVVLWLASTALLAGLLRQALGGNQATSGHQQMSVGRGRPGGLRTLLQSLANRGRAIGDADLFAIAVASAASLGYQPLAQALQLGQATILVLFLLLLAPWLLRRDHPGLAGATIALAAFIKISPIVLLAYFLLRGRWRVVLGAAVTAGLLCVAIISVVGLQGFFAMRQILANDGAESIKFQNQSLARVPMWIGVELTGHVSSVALALGTVLLVLVALAFFAVVGASQFRATGEGPRATRTMGHHGDRDQVGYVWAMCTMVLVSPVTWEHHDAWLLPAFLFCLGFATRALTSGIRDASGKLKPEVFVVVAAVVGYTLTLSDLPFNYDHLTAFSTDPVILNHPVRPIFMLVRPLAALLVWGAAGILYLRASPSSGYPLLPGARHPAVKDAQAAAPVGAGATSDPAVSA
jgi:glycosyl transferase family 87